MCNIPRVRSRAEVEAERKRLCSRQMLQGTFYDLLPASLKASWRVWHLCAFLMSQSCVAPTFHLVLFLLRVANSG